MTVSAALARALASARPGLNARVAAARKAQPGFDAGTLAAAVRDRLDPLVVAVDQVAPDRTEAVAVAGFEMAVTLVGQRLIGPAARHPFVDRLWTEVAPAFAPAIADRPTSVLGGLTNAVLRLAATYNARPDEWLELMRSLAPLADADTIPAAGQVAAWRTGMAQYRDGGLRAADTLPADLALAALGMDGDWPRVRAALADRWWTPVDRGASKAFGGFAGLGGPFAEPPTVVATEQGFLVASGERHGLLIADAFGATFHPASAEAYGAGGGDRPHIRGSSIEAGDRVITTDLPAEGLAAVANADSIAITSPFSHFVLVHPRRLP